MWMIDSAAPGVQVFRNAVLTLVRHGPSLSLITCLLTADRSRVATRDLTLNITIFTWIGLLHVRYDRFIPFSFLILIGRFATLNA
jgi:hypothetical protein